MLCAADEAAVELFLSQRIKFSDITRYVALALEKHNAISNPTLEEIIAADTWAGEQVRQMATGDNSC